MHFTTLEHVRQQLSDCFERSREALFPVSDALLSESQARSLPDLSWSVFFERRWPSVYEALQDGRLDGERLRPLWVQTLVAPGDERVWLGLDSRGMARPAAESSQDRGMIYGPHLPHATTPVSVGGQFSTRRLWPEPPSSWVGILDQRRIASTQTAIAVGIDQVRALPAWLRQRAILLADRWDAGASFVGACYEVQAQALIRLKRHRKWSRPAPPRQPKQRGAPRKQGPLKEGTRKETHGPADGSGEGIEEHGKRVVVSCWKPLPVREAPQVEVRVIRVQREAARDTTRDPRESGVLWLGQQEVPLEQGRSW